MLTSHVNFQARNLLSKGIAIATVALMAACGGGSDKHHPAPPPPPPPPPPTGVMYDVIQIIEDPTAIIRVTSTGINQFDQVAGTILFPEGPSRAFLFNGTRTIDLGDLGGGNSQAFGINRCGHVAGWSLAPGGGDIPQAFLYNGTLRNIGMPGFFSQAVALNDCDQVVGAASFGGSSTRAFLYDDGVMRDLGTLGGARSEAADINAAGVVTGSSLVPDNNFHAFIYDSRTDAGMQDLGTLGGGRSFAFAINEAGQVAGAAENEEGMLRAFRYSGGVMQNLGTLEGDDFSSGVEINNAGFVVGFSATTTGPSAQRGFVHDGVRMREITLPGDRFSEAAAINASGEVVGSATFPDGTVRALSWTLAQGAVDLNTRLYSPSAGLVVLRALAINDKGSIVATSNNGLVLLRVRR